MNTTTIDPTVGTCGNCAFRDAVTSHCCHPHLADRHTVVSVDTLACLLGMKPGSADPHDGTGDV